MESAAVLKRGVGYEMSRLGHYLTQVGHAFSASGHGSRRRDTNDRSVMIKRVGSWELDDEIAQHPPRPLPVPFVVLYRVES